MEKEELKDLTDKIISIFVFICFIAVIFCTLLFSCWAALYYANFLWILGGLLLDSAWISLLVFLIEKKINKE